MLTRLYADNFLCLVNFELALDESNVLLGANGSGKTSALEVLRRIRALVSRRERIEDVFPIRDLCLSQNRDKQHFELDLKIDGDSYRYLLVVEHDRPNKQMRIGEEALFHEGKPIFEFRQGDAQLYHDNYKKGPAYPFDWGLSGIGVLNERLDNRKLTKFKHALANFIIASPCPPLFESESRSEDSRADTLGPFLEDFVGWYRGASQENMGAIGDLFGALREVLPGFNSMHMVESGEHSRALKVSFLRPDGNRGANRKRRTDLYGFSQLSDGQRMLVALYSLIFLAADRPYLFLDEPDNYLALREIQPWLALASEQCGDTLEQLVLVSHHPVTIDYLAGASGRWFFRDGTGPVRVNTEPPELKDALSLSEIVARGWEE